MTPFDWYQEMEIKNHCSKPVLFLIFFLVFAPICRGQIVNTPSLGLSFRVPKGFGTNQQLTERFRERFAKKLYKKAKIPYLYFREHWQLPSMFLVMTAPCPNEPMPKEVGPLMRQGFIKGVGTMEARTEGWVDLNGQPAFVATARGTIQSKNSDATPIPAICCFTAIAHQGTLVIFLFVAHESAYEQDYLAYAQLLQSIRWKK